MNAQSSRSHCCFVLHITGVNESRNTRVQGCLNLVDLAGSERLARSGATGARAKETAAINKSLSALVDVFDALARKRAHVPFRNSKLTYLMQGCLSGNGKNNDDCECQPNDSVGWGDAVFAALCQAGQPNRARKGQGTQNVGGTLGLIVLLLDDKDTRSALSFIVKAKQIAVCPKARCCEQNGKAPKAPPVVLLYIPLPREIPMLNIFKG